MRIERVELYFVAIPIVPGSHRLLGERPTFAPNWIPGFPQQDLKLYLLRLVTDGGIEGVAAVPAMGGERDGLGNLLGAYLIGVNPLDLRLVNQRIEEFGYIGMRNGWIDAACWDIAGKVRGEPLWKMLGGSGGTATPYASLGSNHEHSPVIVARLVRERREQGYAGVKIRVKSLDLERMVEVVAAAREAAGPDMQLMVDANLGWPVELIRPSPRWDLELATRFAQAIERYEVAWLEEPLHRGDFHGLAALRKATRTPVAGGEINASWLDFQRMLELGSLDVYQPDATMAGGTFAGGISVVHWLQREILRRNAARAAGDKPVRYSPHTWTNGLGFAVNLQLFGALPPSERGLLELPCDELWTSAVWARFLRGGFPRQEGGRIAIPDGPGLGVEVDWGVIHRYGRRVYVGTPARIAGRALAEYGLGAALRLRRDKEELAHQSEAAPFAIPAPPF